MKPDGALNRLLLRDPLRSVRPRESVVSPQRYSAKRMMKPVTFIFQSTQAKTVYVIGDFNDWHPTSHPMKRQPDGGWMAQIPLNHGHHRYCFLVDGATILDPRALGTAEGPIGERVSLMAVS